MKSIAVHASVATLALGAAGMTVQGQTAAAPESSRSKEGALRGASTMGAGQPIGAGAWRETVGGDSDSCPAAEWTAPMLSCPRFAGRP